MNNFDKYVTFAFLTKFLFLILSISHLYFKFSHKNDQDIKIIFWRERVEFVFITLMSFMLLFLFFPLANNIIYIDNETKLLLFIFGIILLTSAKWEVFIKESPVFKKFQKNI